MGEAKKRGIFEQRLDEAMERNRLEHEAHKLDMLRRSNAFDNRQGKSRLARIAMAAAIATGLSIKIVE